MTRKTRINTSAQQDRERKRERQGEKKRMKGCEGMQLFKQLFDTAVTATSVTHSGSNGVEISQTFIPLVQWFSALCWPLSVYECVWTVCVYLKAREGLYEHSVCCT